MNLSPYRQPAERPPEGPGREERRAAPRRLGSWRSHHGIQAWPILKRPTIVLVAAFAFVVVLGGSAEALLPVLVIPGILLAWALMTIGSLALQGVVDLHTGGVVIKTPRRRAEVLFDDVDELWLDIVHEVPRNVRAIRLKRFDGSTVEVPLWLEDGQRLLDAVQLGCSAYLVSEGEQALGEGASLDFVEIKLSAQGFWHEEHFVAWENVGRARLGIGLLAFDLVWKDAPPRSFELSLRDVPHPYAFLRLVKLLVGERAQL